MTSSRAARPLKGAAVTAFAILVCHVILSAGYAAARAKKRADPSNAWADFDVRLATFALGLVIVMPLILWIGMRITGEKDNYALVIGGSLAWLFGAGYNLSYIECTPSKHLPLPLLVALVAVGGLLSLDSVASQLTGRAKS
ncbi:hypothetical protein ABZ851_31650 [Streptomyces sp. NPDC047049]|uniref:hypothetical protein n=1 Tax=Streptomyces sp. NPDC047049 TaxID=3156688 RepID=UPI0033FA538A